MWHAQFVGTDAMPAAKPSGLNDEKSATGSHGTRGNDAKSQSFCMLYSLGSIPEELSYVVSEGNADRKHHQNRRSYQEINHTSALRVLVGDAENGLKNVRRRFDHGVLAIHTAPRLKGRYA